MPTNTNQIKRLLYSFVIAFIFWFFIKSEDIYSVTTKIPLVARNLQEKKTYKEEVPESIIVTLKGSGRAFIWLRFFDNFYEDYKAVLDLSSIADEYNFELNQYYKNNPERLVDRLINMKIDQKVNIDIKGEGQPKIPHPDDDDWSGISLPWMAFGYGVSMTPLQTLTFYNAVANNGEMVKPSFISSVGAFGEKPIYTIDREVIMPSICSNETLSSVQKMLNNVVSKPWGTANNIYDKNIKIAGKTGTTQLDYTSNETQYVSSFVGYFPADNPKYSAIVVINKPNKSKGFYGGIVAAPVFKKVAQKIITGIPIEIEISKKDIDILF